MSSRVVSFPEKVFAALGEIFRYHMKHAPHRLAILKDVLQKEIAPPRPSEWSQIVREFRNLEIFLQKKNKYADFTVRDMMIRTAVCLEIILWFFVGEQIGRGNFAGYIVPATYIPKATRKKAQAAKCENPTEF